MTTCRPACRRTTLQPNHFGAPRQRTNMVRKAPPRNAARPKGPAEVRLFETHVVEIRHNKVRTFETRGEEVWTAEVGPYIRVFPPSTYSRQLEVSPLWSWHKTSMRPSATTDWDRSAPRRTDTPAH